MAEEQLILLVPRRHVKSIKSGLEKLGYFNRSKSITPEIAQEKEGRMIITTSVHPSLYDVTERGAHDEDKLQFIKESILRDIGCTPLTIETGISLTFSARDGPTIVSKNAVIKALFESLTRLPEGLLEMLHITAVDLAASFPESYSVYKPLLLLPSHAFSSQSWINLTYDLPVKSEVLEPIWTAVTASVGCTHLATNAGIPLRREDLGDEADKENILRSPTNLTPIYGSFGPPPSPQTLTSPTSDDFSAALWVSCQQNGIHQVWAPLYTMFSRGNIREKTRLLTHPTVVSCLGSTAVDLYAGIGYFAFSYARAGLRPVLCWELNPWSIEGLRRGAALNGWTTAIFPPSSLPVLDSSDPNTQEWISKVPDADFLIFQQSNEYASSIVPLLTRNKAQGKGGLAPIRHINMGLLPTSSLSWPTAIGTINSKLGGWLHVHENVDVNEIQQKSDEIECELQDLLDKSGLERGMGERRDGDNGKRKVRVEHVERVKTFAPGVVHAVFDVCVDGEKDVECGDE
jgi:tRNA wybutosine-synthesizing protein 2